MTDIVFTDSLPVGSVRMTDDGYLTARVPIARAGIQEYTGKELGRPDIPVVRMYRPEASVFNQSAMAKIPHKPVIIDHTGDVTPKNWKQKAVGHMGGSVARDGDRLTVDLVLMDAQGIEEYEAGRNQLSLSYSAPVEFVDGQDEHGNPFNAVMGPISKVNHTAMVFSARAGADFKIGDNHPGHDSKPTFSGKTQEVQKMHTVKILHDGVTVEVSEQGGEVIRVLQTRLADSAIQAEAVKTQHASALAAKDTELAAKDVEIAALKESRLDDAAITAKVHARANLLEKANSLHKDDGYVAMSDSDIRKAALTHCLADAATVLDGKSEAYVEARFDAAVEALGSNPDSFQKSMADGSTAVAKTGKSGDAKASTMYSLSDSQKSYQDQLTEAWKRPAQA